MAKGDTRLVFGALSPHPPIVIPSVGKGEEAAASATIEGLKKLGEKVAALAPDTLIVMTPHGPVARDAYLIQGAPVLSGDMRQFRAPEVRIQLPNDTDLAKKIRDASVASGIECVVFNDPVPLDHGVMVPLYYMYEAGYRGNLVVISISLFDLKKQYRFGQVLSQVVEKQRGKKVGFVASGDLSHRLLPEAPAGYDPAGAQFDQLMTQALKCLDEAAIVNIDLHLADRAGECGLRPICVLMGVLGRYQALPELISYEGPFGVGYAVFFCRISALKTSFAVELAKRSLEHYLRTGEYLECPKNLPEELRHRAGAFVSIHSHGELRGCIGTIAPTKDNVAEEIIQNAVSAGIDDPRFEPISLSELPELEFKVDVLSPMEPVSSVSQLDPCRYGVLVKKGHRSGVLLPDLPGVNSVKEQLRIAKLKAGIHPDDSDVELFRFTVTRYE
ncbi:MAG TPA: AmmeMemoRadiSam system protein A [Firmicutes bacterium]|nr:AmmeMemoRadiSam system protein A [Bacillota bacterium]